MSSFSTRVRLPLAPGAGRLARSRCAVADLRGCSHFGLLCSFQSTVAHRYHTKADLPSRLVLASSCHKPSSLGAISTELCERIISMQWWFMISTELYHSLLLVVAFMLGVGVIGF